ncbi:MAG: tRNA (guanosine(46)-N7)-methyltransferase TrmB [bacterium]
MSLPPGRRVKIEIGFGKGASILAAACDEPATFFLGVEAAGSYAALVQARARRAGIENALLLHGDGVKVLHELPESSVDKISVLFPDPWPKRRHAKRRIMGPAFIRLAATRLTRDGALVFKTDVESYFRGAVPLLDAEPLLARALATSSPERLARLAPITSFEKKYRVEGRRIFGCVYVRSDRPAGSLPP